MSISGANSNAGPAGRTGGRVGGLFRRSARGNEAVAETVPTPSQWGDPQTRDMTKKATWGTGGSGRAIGVSEVSPKRTHVTGAVGAAYAGDPRMADSQIYVVISPQPQLNRTFTVWGHVIAGMEVVTQLRVPDVIRRATIKAPAK